MGFEGASFLVVIDKDYGLRMLTAQGEPASIDDYFFVAQLFDEHWGEKPYIYFAEGKDGLYKVGVTNSITRRQKELGVRFVHTIACHPKRIYDLEARLHRLFKSWHVRGEWFDLKRGLDFDPIERIKTINNELKLTAWLDSKQR